PTSEAIARQVKPEAKPEIAAPAIKEADKPVESAKEAPPAEAAKPAEMPKPAITDAKPAASEEKQAKARPAEESRAAGAEAKPVEAPKPVADAPKKTAAPPPDAKPADTSAVDVWRDSEGVRLTFSFAEPVPAASFRRGDTVWLVFDSAKPFDLEPI